MRTAPFGSTGREVSIVGQGTWNMERDERSRAIAALRRGLDLGMNHIDTAEMYGDGRVEELVGEAIRGRRDEVFLVSKVLPTNASRRGTIAACERSLKRLGVERLDCYLLHWPGSHPVRDTIAAFEELVTAGKIASWGVSNFAEEELAEVIAIAGEGRCACNQVLYHLQERAIEHAVIPYCRDHEIAVVAYSPFGSGHFPRPDSRGGRALAEAASALGATPYQVALAFLLRQGIFAIPKSSTVEHVEANAAAAALELTDADAEPMSKAFPRGRRRRGVPVL
ncbi:MAG TPA: aldo/keto reductase [Thermoanaerobaculia bacterium]|nr:aldo/keto reductase [Thermoanaerobaculia bacterium]